MGAKPPEADDNVFCENMLFSHDFKNDIAIFQFNAYKCSIRNGGKINLEREK